MTNPIASGGASSLTTLQFLQAHQPAAKPQGRPSGNPVGITPATSLDEDLQERLAAARANGRNGGVNPALNLAQQRRMAEIKSIAQQAGFVGLNDQDIQRATVHGTSLLVDYKV